ncbi:MAG TPA: hypothetical protein VGQ99_13545 [Tepidisphaeraceae bacterium]|jgi:hypothetical protein|nr:hypothetical protein [Tepidisphaeraceae bacterium]HEV8606391.1 hypothetical protein [Tepidisphaeraceae bacterium]
MSRRSSIVSACIAFTLFGAALAHGAVIIMTPEVVHDLTAGGTVTVNSAIFSTTDQQPTGSGVIHSFVRVSAANQSIVEGYNTDGRPLQFDENTSAIFTRSQKLSDMKIVTVGNEDYYKFLLDINQQANDPLLTLNEVEIYLGNAPNLLSYSPNRSAGGTGFGANSTFVYDLDFGTDNALDLNYNLNAGSGSGDMYAFIPKRLFTGPNNYVYLYSKFGVPHANNDGFEEWAAIEGPNNVVPEPSALLATVLLSLLLAARIRPARRFCIA